MNLIRDPADRIESMFYYNRKEGRWKKQKHKPPSEWFAKNFEKCITSGDKECQVCIAMQIKSETIFIPGLDW